MHWLQFAISETVQKPYIIRVSSTKGGVGKSTIAINLAVAIQMYGYRTLIVDLDMINPSVGLYLGLANVNMGAVEAIMNKVDISRAVVPHAATGLRVLPGKIENKYLIPSATHFNTFFSNLQKLDYDFIIVDTQPGIPSTEILTYYDEALLITLPDEASSISAVKMLKHYSADKLRCSIVVNRVGNKRYELSIREIEELCESKVSGILPEDENVKVSVSEHIPLYLKNEHEPFSSHIETISTVYTSRSGVIRSSPPNESWLSALINRILNRK